MVSQYRRATQDEAEKRLVDAALGEDYIKLVAFLVIEILFKARPAEMSQVKLLRGFHAY